MSITIHERQTDGILSGIKNAALRQIGGKSEDQKMTKEFINNKCIDLIATKKSRADWTPEEKQKCNKPYDRYIFNEAFKLSDKQAANKMYKAYVEKCSQNNNDAVDYEGFCKNFKAHRKWKALPEEQKFNDYNCAVEILKQDNFISEDVEFRENKKTKDCISTYSNDDKKVFDKAFEKGKDSDKSKILKAYNEKCKERRNFPDFCANFKPPADYVPRTRAQNFNDFECGKIIDKKPNDYNWSKIERNLCGDLINPNIFEGASKIANDEQKKSLDEAYTKWCKNYHDYDRWKGFCKKYSEPKK